MPKLTGFPRVALPGPPPVPVLGHMPRVLQFFGDPIAALRALRHYGDVVAVSKDSPSLVCVFGPERNREVLGNPAAFPHDEEFIHGPPGTPLARVTQVIVNINGDVHKRHRKLMMPAFTRAALEGYVEPIVRVTEGVVASWPVDQVADLDALTRHLALCTAVQTLFGLDVLAGATALGELAAEFVETVASPLAIALPYNVPGLPYRRAAQVGGRLLGELDGLIARKRAAAGEPGDALSLLLRAVDDEVAGFTDDELVAETLTLFIAGHETTAKTLMWTLFLLERHPDVLADVLDEVHGVLGGRTMTQADAAKLPLLDRVVRESMRLLTAVPISFMRAPKEDTALGSVRLPAHANIIVSAYATHHDPELYPEPQRFLPERWSTIKPTAYEYLPFGAGPRVCVGATFAQQALRLMLPTLLQRVRFSLVRDADISRLTRANIFGVRRGMPVHVHRAHRERLAPAPIRGDLAELVTFPAAD